MHTRFYWRRVDQTLDFLSTYTTGKPAGPQLSAYFRSNRSMGSKDRRTLRKMVYNWFRVGFTFNTDLRNQIDLANVLLEAATVENVNRELELPSNWPKLSITDRLIYFERKLNWSSEEIFPVDMCSRQLDKKKILHHQLVQPMVWITGPEPDLLLRTLNAAGHPCLAVAGNAIGVEPNVPLQEILANQKYQIQDLSSQRVIHAFQEGLKGDETVWDACTGSGGKALKILNYHPQINLLASDRRPQILKSFSGRMGQMQYDIPLEQIDLLRINGDLQFKGRVENKTLGQSQADVVIVDAPCSGSGTWNRNPEFLNSFNGDVKAYAGLQQNILQAVWPYLREGGVLLFITCSVFTEENEANTEEFIRWSNGDLLKEEYFHGYDNRSDSMYHAIIRKQK